MSEDRRADVRNVVTRERHTLILESFNALSRAILLVDR